MSSTIQPMRSLPEQILKFLESHALGRENAITREKLSEIFNIDGRTLREIIHRLRKAEQPILSVVIPPGGYFIPASIDEIDEAMTQLYSRQVELYKACLGIKRGLERRFPEMNRQIKLFQDIA